MFNITMCICLTKTVQKNFPSGQLSYDILCVEAICVLLQVTLRTTLARSSMSHKSESLQTTSILFHSPKACEGEAEESGVRWWKLFHTITCKPPIDESYSLIYKNSPILRSSGWSLVKEDAFKEKVQRMLDATQLLSVERRSWWMRHFCCMKFRSSLQLRERWENR